MSAPENSRGASTLASPSFVSFPQDQSRDLTCGENAQMSLTKVFEKDPRSFRASFASKFSAFLHSEYQNPEEVAVCFGVRYQTAFNWWNGTNRPSGDVVAIAFMQRGASLSRHIAG